MTLNVDISDEELAARKAKWQPRETEGYNRISSRDMREMVTSGNRGAILGKV